MASGLVALVSSSTLVQGLTIIAAPLLARLYSPDSFGIFSLIISVAAIVVTASSLKLELAIPLMASLDEGRAIMRICMVSGLVAGLVSAVLVGFFSGALSDSIGTSVLPWAWGLVPVVLLTSWFVTQSQAAIKHRAYKSVATRTLAQGVGTTASQLALGPIIQSAGGLLVGQIIGRSLGIVALARGNRELFVRPPRSTYAKALRKYWRFPAVFMPSALLNTLGTQLPLIIVGSWFGIVATGHLGLTQRIVLVPATLLGAAVGQVFYGELSARLRAGESVNRRMYLSISWRLALGGTAITIVLFAASPALFPIVLGQEWAVAGQYAQALALSAGLGFVASPLSFVFVAYQSTVQSVLVDTSRIALVGGSALIGRSMEMTAVSTIWLMYLGQALNYIVMWILGLRIVTMGVHPTDGNRPRDVSE